MAFNVNDIKSRLRFEGARPTLFQVEFTNPVNGLSDGLVPFMAQASEIPPSIVEPIQVPYFGRTIKVAGDRTYPDWNVMIMNDEDFPIRNALEEWSNMINGFENNLRQETSYKTDARVTQYAKDGSIRRVYRFIGIFPISVGAIQLSWEAQNQIETFDTTFAYDYWVIDGGNTGNAGGF